MRNIICPSPLRCNSTKKPELKNTIAKCFAYDFVCIIYNYAMFALASHVRFASLALTKPFFINASKSAEDGKKRCIETKMPGEKKEHAANNTEIASHTTERATVYTAHSV